ncbi:MAG: YicC/YloC family endoribonuclease, partial [Steroidobacteraceae bacterium]
MTGFARRETAGTFGTLVCEIRSVNHRFLDATLRLPDNARSLEPELRQAVAGTLKRGKIDCTISARGAD